MFVIILAPTTFPYFLNKDWRSDARVLFESPLTQTLLSEGAFPLETEVESLGADDLNRKNCG